MTGEATGTGAAAAAGAGDGVANGAAAGAGTGGATGAAAGTGGVAFDWSQHGIAGDDLGFVQNKGFKGPADTVSAYRNLEKLMGAPAERLIKLPEGDDPAQWRGVYERLGAGKTVEDYKLPVPQGDNGEFAKTAANWFHEAGVPVKTAQKLAENWNKHVADLTTAQGKAQAEKDAAEATVLRGEYGPKYDEMTQRVDRAAATFGMSTDELLALKATLGPAKAMKFMDRIGSKLGVDDTLIGAEKGAGFGASSPEAARSRIAELRADKAWVAKYTSGDAEAKREMERLNRIAYG